MASSAARLSALGSDPTVDLHKLFMHESGGIADAHNATGGGFGAIGLGQIRKPALDDWNTAHPDEQYTAQDLFHMEPNAKITNWYVNTRIPQQLKNYGVPDTLENRVGAYNVGALNIKRGKIPTQYIQGYKEAGNVNDN